MIIIMLKIMCLGILMCLLWMIMSGISFSTSIRSTTTRRRSEVNFLVIMRMMINDLMVLGDWYGLIRMKCIV